VAARRPMMHDGGVVNLRDRLGIIVNIIFGSIGKALFRLTVLPRAETGVTSTSKRKLRLVRSNRARTISDCSKNHNNALAKRGLAWTAIDVRDDRNQQSSVSRLPELRMLKSASCMKRL